RDVLQQRVGGRLLAERPQLAQEVTRGTAREPVAAELVAEEVAQLRLERPRAQVARDIEAAVDVVEVALGIDRQLQRVAEQLDVTVSHRARVLGLEELDLVEELRGVAADEVEQ